MNPLSTAEIACIQADAEETMLDTCKVANRVVDTEWGSGTDDEPTFTFGSAISCGVNQNPKGENREGDQSPLIDAKIRLPAATTIVQEDRIQVTHRFGTALGTAEVYSVAQPPRVGVSAIVVVCKLVTGESDA